MESVKQFITSKLAWGVIMSDDQLLEAYSKKHVKFWWRKGAKFRAECSFWRILKQLRQDKYLEDTRREVWVSKHNGSIGDYEIIFYKLK